MSSSIFRSNNKKNMNFYIIFYIGELDNKGRPHGFGYWRGVNMEGEVLIGYWFHGIPVGPFKCRDFKTGSGFMCIKIGYGKTNCESGDLEIGLADTECCVSGAFYRTFPRVVFYNLNLTQVNKKKKNNEDKHGLIEKKECCEYLNLNKASNDILRIDYSKLLDVSDGDEIKFFKEDINNIYGEKKQNLFNNDSQSFNEKLSRSFMNDDTFLKGELLNYDDIYNMSYSIKAFTLEDEIKCTLDKNVEERDEEQQLKFNKYKMEECSSSDMYLKKKMKYQLNSKEEKEKEIEKEIEKERKIVKEKKKNRVKEQKRIKENEGNIKEKKSSDKKPNEYEKYKNVKDNNKKEINLYRKESINKNINETSSNKDMNITSKVKNKTNETYRFSTREEFFNTIKEIEYNKKGFEVIEHHKKEFEEDYDLLKKDNNELINEEEPSKFINKDDIIENNKKEKEKKGYKMLSYRFSIKDKKRNKNNKDQDENLNEKIDDETIGNKKQRKDTIEKNEKEQNKKKIKKKKNGNGGKNKKRYNILVSMGGKIKNKESEEKRKIKKKIGYSMTNTLLNLKSYNSLRMKKKKKNGNRKAFLPRALSGTLPKLKIKAIRRKLLFSDTITNVYKTKCMNIILQNLCPHMPNFGIIYNTDLHISIDAERGLYITGYINKKNSNLLCDKAGANDYEDNEVKIKIIKKSKCELGNKKGDEKRLYSWIDDIKELSLDGWVKCELAGCLEAVIFIHGYNTSHLEALQILGQMASFGNFPNYIKLFLFNWPSGKNFLEFFIARDNSKNKKVHHAFKSFLDTLRNNGIKQIHIITHSMGTRMFLLAFHDIVNSGLFSTIDEKESPSKNISKMKLITLTMMNPEYYLNDFVNKEYIFLRSFCTVISIYCDSNDKALKWAEIFSGTKSLGKNIFDLNICKEDQNYQNLNAYENFVFDSNKLEYYSIPIENRTDETEEISLDHKFVSSFIDSDNFPSGRDNDVMRKKGFITMVVQKLRRIFHFFRKQNKINSTINDQHSIENNERKNLNKKKQQKVLHQPPMFRNTLLVFTGIEPTYCHRYNRDWLDVDVIDTTWLGSNVHTLRHSYWSLNREIIEDIRELIVTRKRARQRTSRLDRREGNVWVYRVAPSHLKSIFDSDL